jgi:hypothetical protein
MILNNACQTAQSTLNHAMRPMVIEHHLEDFDIATLELMAPEFEQKLVPCETRDFFEIVIFRDEPAIECCSRDES